MKGKGPLLCLYHYTSLVLLLWDLLIYESTSLNWICSLIYHKLRGGVSNVFKADASLMIQATNYMIRNSSETIPSTPPHVNYSSQLPLPMWTTEFEDILIRDLDHDFDKSEDKILVCDPFNVYLYVNPNEENAS